MTKPLKELLAEQARLDAAIAAARKEASKEALTEVLRLVNEFSFTVQQVFPWKPVAKKAESKYLDEKTGATWSGRGKPPAWIAGKNREDFLIERPQAQDGPFLAQMAAAAAKD
jgi:DNA-binding protein H-NS